jgi:ubiquinone/menaquinone biosynthesis C-methylase UbiE
MRQACLVPEMSASAKTFCTSSPYRLLARRVVLPWVLQGLRPTDEVLEIGAGSGAMTAGLLARFPDLTVVATDYDPEMVAGASRSLSSWSGRVTVGEADATDLPFDDGRFSLVLSCAMLHHVVGCEQALSEATRLLRPGGRLVGFDLLHVAGTKLPHHHRHSRDPSEQADQAGHTSPSHDAAAKRLVDPNAFERELTRLGLTSVLVRRSLGGLAFRFLATRSS